MASLSELSRAQDQESAAALAQADTQPASPRNVVFVSKATPGDDEFVLWLAPRLEAAGYEVFADIITLNSGGRWRPTLTKTLQQRTAKMLLCCSDETLVKEGVQEEIGIALDLAKELKDPNFLIPLRIRPHKKLFGIGELQQIDFVQSWAKGLETLLKALAKQSVPVDPERVQINQNWDLYRRRNAIEVKPEPEALTSNWLRIVEAPDYIRYFEPTGAIDQGVMKRACKDAPFPTEIYERGFFSFAEIGEVSEAMSSVGRFRVGFQTTLAEFLRDGLPDRKVRPREASNVLISMFRQAWSLMCRGKGLFHYAWSSYDGFHASKDQLAIGKKVPWGRQGRNRSSMLRNIAKGFVWQFGISAVPMLWPYPHMRLKSRVLFNEVADNEAGPVVEEPKKQHKLRRRVCTGWRNKQWHGRMMAMLELLSGDMAYIYLPLGSGHQLTIDATPVEFTSPVTTELPDEMGDEQEETDPSTLVDAPSEEEAA